MSIPFVDLQAQYVDLKHEIDTGIQRVLDHGRFVSDPEVQEFEAALAEHVGVVHVVSCGNGTDALTLALMGEKIGPGDAVFLPSLTFAATAETVPSQGSYAISLFFLQRLLQAMKCLSMPNFFAYGRADSVGNITKIWNSR